MRTKISLPKLGVVKNGQSCNFSDRLYSWNTRRLSGVCKVYEQRQEQEKSCALRTKVSLSAMTQPNKAFLRNRHVTRAVEMVVQGVGLSKVNETGGEKLVCAQRVNATINLNVCYHWIVSAPNHTGEKKNHER